MGQVSKQIKLSSALIFRQEDDPMLLHHYICNQNINKNLKILVSHRVVRVIFDCVRFPSGFDPYAKLDFETGFLVE